MSDVNHLYKVSFWRTNSAACVLEFADPKSLTLVTPQGEGALEELTPIFCRFGPQTISAKDLGQGKIFRPSSSSTSNPTEKTSSQFLDHFPTSCVSNHQLPRKRWKDVWHAMSKSTLPPPKILGRPNQLIGIRSRWHLFLGLSLWGGPRRPRTQPGQGLLKALQWWSQVAWFGFNKKTSNLELPGQCWPGFLWKSFKLVKLIWFHCLAVQLCNLCSEYRPKNRLTLAMLRVWRGCGKSVPTGFATDF